MDVATRNGLAGLKLERMLAQRADRARRMHRVTSGLAVYDGRHDDADIMDTLTKNTDGFVQVLPNQQRKHGL